MTPLHSRGSISFPPLVHRSCLMVAESPEAELLNSNDVREEQDGNKVVECQRAEAPLTTNGTRVPAQTPQMDDFSFNDRRIYNEKHCKNARLLLVWWSRGSLAPIAVGDDSI